jgi:hypothetical protein
MSLCKKLFYIVTFKTNCLFGGERRYVVLMFNLNNEYFKFLKSLHIQTVFTVHNFNLIYSNDLLTCLKQHAPPGTFLTFTATANSHKGLYFI